MSLALSTYAGVIVIVVAALFRREARKTREDLLTAIGFSIFIAAGIKMHITLARLLPRTLDPLFLQLDRAIGFDPMRIMHAAQMHVGLTVLLAAAYWLLSAMMGLAWAAEQNPATRLSALIAGVLCFAFYAAFPAVGPAFYNWSAGVPLFAPRNCMPSMHLTWAILIAWNARSRWLRLTLWTYAGLMAVATVALGQHYLIDLLAAVPYAMAMQWITMQFYARRRVAAPALETNLSR